MTPHALKLKLAALDGWMPVPANGFTMYRRGPVGVNSHHDLPNYPEDLNALRKIELKLTTQQESDYLDVLNGNVSCRFKLLTTPATKRAEALLIVLGK